MFVLSGLRFSFRALEVPKLFCENDLFLTLGLGTSNARNKNLRPLFNTNNPLLVGNMASETTFGHWKVVFSWGKGRKMTFSQNPLSSRFWASGFWMSILSSANFKKDPPWNIFFLSVHAPATSALKMTAREAEIQWRWFRMSLFRHSGHFWSFGAFFGHFWPILAPNSKLS